MNSKTEVFEYLQQEGWKVALATLYNHCTKGWLLPENTGQYEKKKVDKYARERLKNKVTGINPDEERERLADRRLRADTRTAEIRARRQARADSIEQGKLIPRKDLDLEMAGRAAIFSNGLRQIFKKQALEWVRLVNGDKAKARDLIDAMTGQLENTLNDLASTHQFEIVLLENKK